MNKQAQDEVADSEAAIISALAPLAAGAAGAFGLADDCALITPEAGSELVLKTDPIAEGVHFFPDDAPEDIAWKALAVNVSDLVAKGARPIGYLMALAFPRAPTVGWLSRFACGLRAAQTRFGCHLIGGDTDRRPGPLTISITAIGAIARGRMVKRSTAREGDLLFVSGTIGDATLGLALRRAPGIAAAWGLSVAEASALRLRFARPEPRLGLAAALIEHASAAMDISDGLVKDLGRLCAASGASARVQLPAIPLSSACAKATQTEPALLKRILSGGEDYEVLASVAAQKGRAFRSAAGAAGVAVTEIGGIGKGEGVLIAGSDGRPLSFERTGWDHFA